jgi:TetR/AcrR family transcriptional regulator, transcriptional repressor for nem operon
MRVSKEQVLKNKTALLDAASRLIRRTGIEGTGVAEVAAEAGLTHGALYAHFSSKEELVAEAFWHGFVCNIAATRAWVGDRKLGFEDYLDGLLSSDMRADLEGGCPMAALASEIGRQGRGVSASFAKAFEQMVEMLETSLERTMPAKQRRRLAVAAISAEIGAMAISRAVRKADAALSDEVLQATKEVLTTAHERQRPTAKRS